MGTRECGNLDLPSLVETLVLCHQEKWLRFVQQMVQNREDAEDVVQDAVLRMLLCGRQFHSAEQARMYLGRIICNTAIDLYHMRRRHRRQYRPLPDELPEATHRGNPDLLLCQRENARTTAVLLKLLSNGLARLPVKQYEALRLTVMDPRVASLHDAGAENNIPYSTLRHRSIKGLRRLRRFLHRAVRAAPMRLVLA